MVGPLMCGRRGATALQTAAAHATRADRRPLLGPGLADRTPTPRVPGHYLLFPSSSAHCGPSAVSVTSIPASLSRSRIWSACRPVAAGAGVGPARQRPLHQHVDRRQRRRGLVARLPALVERVAAQDGHHRPDRPRVGHRRVVVAGVERPVALGARGVHLGQRDRHRQIVVERRGELRRPLAGHHRADAAAHPVQEVLDAGVGLDRVLQRRLGELQHRPVVRTAEVVAQLGRPNPLQHSGNRQHVAQRLAHLLAAHGDPAVVQPVPGERVAGRLGLGDLVLVVREDQIHSAGVDVELRPEVRLAHRDAFGVPARAAAAPRRRPGRLAGLGALPQREVALVALAGRDALRPGARRRSGGRTASRSSGMAAARRSRRRRRRCRRAQCRSAAR